MSIKNFDENSDKWIVHSTNLAKNIILLDLAGIFESNNIEDALKEINDSLKNTYTKEETDKKFENIDSFGGFYLVDSLTERDAIPTDKREEGMLCWVRNDKIIYQLVGGIENTNWIEFKTNSDDIEITLNYDDISYIGSDEPENQEIIWFDDSIDGESEITEYNPIINELKNIISSMSQRIIKLEEQVEFLLLNGGGGGGGNTDTDDNNGIYLILEDGSKLLLENGSGVVLEQSSSMVTTNTLTLEDGSKLLLENGSKLLLEN